MRVERSLIDDLATRDVNQGRVLLHQTQFAGTDQSLGRGRQRRANDEDIGDAQHLVEAVGRRDPVGRFVARGAAVDRVNFIPKARIRRAVATPTLPKPRMPQTPPCSIRLALL